MAVHRIIEANAARCGDTLAIADTHITLSYRELNLRANAVARLLGANGFRRGHLATVRLPPAASTATVLFGILKAGGTYVLIDSEDKGIGWPRGVSFAESADADEVCYRTIDVTPALSSTPSSCANLPIVTRASDIACVISDRDGSPVVLVPHSTIMALHQQEVPPFAEWSGEAGALDLWAALMNGATVTVSGVALPVAA